MSRTSPSSGNILLGLEPSKPTGPEQNLIHIQWALVVLPSLYEPGYNTENRNNSDDDESVVHIGPRHRQIGREEEKHICEDHKGDRKDVHNWAEDSSEIEVSFAISAANVGLVEDASTANEEEDDRNDVRKLEEHYGGGKNGVESGRTA